MATQEKILTEAEEIAALESATSGLKERLAEVDGEAGKVEKQIDGASRRVAVAWAESNLQPGKPGAGARYDAALREAGELQRELEKVRLAERGFKTELGEKESRLRQLREQEAGREAARKQQEFRQRIADDTKRAREAVEAAIAAYEQASLAIGEAVSAIDGLSTGGGQDGIFGARAFAPQLLEGLKPGFLQAKGLRVERPILPDALWEVYLLPAWPKPEPEK